MYPIEVIIANKGQRSIVYHDSILRLCVKIPMNPSSAMKTPNGAVTIITNMLTREKRGC